MTRWRSLLLVLAATWLTARPAAAQTDVVQWGGFEATVPNARTYGDPFRDVTLDATYTRPDGTKVAFWGFHDGGTTWRLRFMPDQPGTWSYAATFSDGAPGASGSFRVVAGDLPGPVTADETNPLWFGFKGGTHGLLRSFHVGDKFFARSFPAAGRAAFLDWAQAQGYDMLAIGSFLLNRDVPGRGQGWDTPDLWDGPTRTFKAAEYQRMEAILGDLAARRLVVFPFAGFFGKASDFPTNHADQELFLRYTLARLSPYWNLVFNTAGPEPLWADGEGQFQNAMRMADLTRLGNLITALDPFRHLLTVHNAHSENAFKDEPWETYTALQAPKTTNRATLSAGLLAAHGPQPLYALELLWPGNDVGHPVYTDVDIRKNGFVIMMSAATLNFGDMRGNSSSGFTGTLDLADRVQSRHDVIKKVWDFFEPLAFWRLSPRQDLVSNGYCLALHGSEYLVYLEGRGRVSVAVTGGPYDVEWINAQNTADRRAGGTTATGAGLTSPTDGDDWLVHLTKPTAQAPVPATPVGALPLLAVGLLALGAAALSRRR